MCVDNKNSNTIIVVKTRMDKIMFSKFILLPSLLSILSVVTTIGETTNTVKVSRTFKEVAKELVKSEESDYSYVNDFYFSGNQYSVYQLIDGDGNYSDISLLIQNKMFCLHIREQNILT